MPNLTIGEAEQNIYCGLHPASIYIKEYY